MPISVYPLIKKYILVPCGLGENTNNLPLNDLHVISPSKKKKIVQFFLVDDDWKTTLAVPK